LVSLVLQAEWASLVFVVRRATPEFPDSPDSLEGKETMGEMVLPGCLESKGKPDAP
jgi:hypothetical protein